MIHKSREEFYSDIEEGFSELTKNYGFDVILKEDNRRVVLSNSKCLLDLKDTEDGLEIYFQEPNNPKFYQPNLINESLGGSIRIPWGVESDDSILEIYKKRALGIIKHIPNPLEGDFKWKPIYDLLEIEQKELVSQIIKLDRSHPIKQSFRKQELEWKKKARKLL